MDSNQLNQIIIALILLYAFAQAGGYIFYRLRLARVIGEIVGGLLLGPSCLGYFLPGAYSSIFQAQGVMGFMEIISWIGLVLLMFISGFEVQQNFKKEEKRWIFTLTGFSTVIPFIAGVLWVMAHDADAIIGSAGNVPALILIIAVSFSITSIPVISRIFLDIGMINTRFAKVVLATATIHDIILWVVVSVAVGMVEKTGIEISDIVRNVIVTLLFFWGMMVIGPRLIKRLNNARLNIFIRSNVTGYILFICFFFSMLAQGLSVNVIFGAFLAGVVLGQIVEPAMEAAKENIRQVALGFFIPVYFAFTGLKIDLIRHFNFMLTLDLIVWAFIAAISASWLASRCLTKDPWRCADFAIAMNARGGPGIVIATVALQGQIINQEVFVMLILLSLVSSLCASSWFYNQLKSKSLAYFEKF